LGTKLKEIMELYCDLLKEAKRDKEQKLPPPVNYIVLTDGKREPGEEKSKLTNFLKSTAQLLQGLEYHENQIGIQFGRVGSDKSATEFL
jgi:hypothetical protein